MSEKEFDVVVWGATGFTGRLVAEHFAQTYPSDSGLKWAIGGRNPEKLAAVAAELGIADAPQVIADASDVSALKAVAERTKVVLTTVGPYQKYGSPLVAACAEVGTDYVDLTGEPNWMRRMIDAHHETARATGARIVHSCGFDSIPFDLGVYFVQGLAREAWGAPARTVKGRMVDMRGAMSGGTAASALATVEAAAHDPLTRQVIRDVYALASDPDARRPRQPDQRTPHYDRDLGKWVAPFIMAEINARNVHRSNMLMDYAYGEDFRYSEMMAAPNAPAAFAIAGALGAFAMGVALPPTRAILRNLVLPKPGEGPSKKQRESGYFKAVFIAKKAGGDTVRAMVSGDRDPGYGATSRMIAEAAVCLARDVPKDEKPGGLYTAAPAMGDALIPRLEARAGIAFAAG